MSIGTISLAERTHVHRYHLTSREESCPEVPSHKQRGIMFKQTISLAERNHV